MIAKTFPRFMRPARQFKNFDAKAIIILNLYDIILFFNINTKQNEKRPEGRRRLPTNNTV